MDCATVSSPYGFRKQSTYETTIDQCSPSGSTSCRGKRDRDWSVEDLKRVAWSDESLFRLLNADFSLRIKCLAHEGLLEQCVKGHPMTPTNLTKLLTALANIWQIIPVKRFQKMVASMPRRGEAINKAREGPTHF
ncbi:hypothetical protein TNCV_4771131 [Trichonephila clavipes]|nr:hypothetical protein TNCV_4771131 [Trichonephila clavipes]